MASVAVGETVSTSDASVQCGVSTDARATSPVPWVDSLARPSVTFLSGYPPVPPFGQVRSSSPFLEDLGTSGLSAILDVAQPGPSSGELLFEDPAVVSSPLHPYPVPVSNSSAAAAVPQAASGSPGVAPVNDDSIVFSG